MQINSLMPFQPRTSISLTSLSIRCIFLASVAALLGPAWAQAASTDAEYGEVFVTTYVPPEYPAELRQEKLEGRVSVRFVVDEAGQLSGARVLQSTDERFEAAALEAVKRWTFSAALEDGKAVARCLDVPVVFRLADIGQTRLAPPPGEEPRPSPTVPAREVSSAAPPYPERYLARGFRAAVRIEFVIDREGKVVEPTVTAASHSGFVPAALASLRNSRFAPAMQGDLPVPSRKGTVVQFEYSQVSVEEGLARDSLAKYGILPGAAAGDAAWDQEPRLDSWTDPVLPYALALEGIGGQAEVDFTVTAGKQLRDINVRSATRPELGAALAAAVAEWVFAPARRAGEAVDAALTVRYDFPDPRSAAQPGARLWQMVASGTVIETARGLDERLRPVCRVAPTYPPSLRAEAPVGRAVMEFIIDREGSVQLVRVVSATHEAFGYAATTALSQWCFDVPRRGGEAVDVRVQIPFDFSPPAQ